MPLIWEVKAVKDYETKFPAVKTADGHEEWNPTTFCLAMISIPVGISKITEENWEKVWLRIAMIEKIIGGYRYSSQAEGHKTVCFTKQEIKDHVGMWTNVNNRTDAEFRKYIFDTLKDTVEREAKAEEKTAC